MKIYLPIYITRNPSVLSDERSSIQSFCEDGRTTIMVHHGFSLDFNTNHKPNISSDHLQVLEQKNTSHENHFRLYDSRSDSEWTGLRNIHGFRLYGFRSLGSHLNFFCHFNSHVPTSNRSLLVHANIFHFFGSLPLHFPLPSDWQCWR